MGKDPVAILQQDTQAMRSKSRSLLRGCHPKEIRTLRTSAEQRISAQMLKKPHTTGCIDSVHLSVCKVQLLV